MFLLKDENTDSDVISDINSVHRVGVFFQITSVFPAACKNDEKEGGLTAVFVSLSENQDHAATQT